MDAETINALKELGAMAWMGILSLGLLWLRKNGNSAKLEKKIDEQSQQISEVRESVARIEGHLNIGKRGR